MRLRELRLNSRGGRLLEKPCGPGETGGTNPYRGTESACQCRRRKRLGFDPWVGRIPYSRKWQPIGKYVLFPIFTDNSNYFLSFCVLAILVAGGSFLKHQGDHITCYSPPSSGNRCMVIHLLNSKSFSGLKVKSRS